MIEYLLVSKPYASYLTMEELNNYGKAGWKLHSIVSHGQENVYHFYQEKVGSKQNKT